MRKVIFILLIASMLLSAVGCSDSSETLMTCPICEEEILEGSKFCSECGANLSLSATKPQDDSLPEESNGAGAGHEPIDEVDDEDLNQEAIVWDGSIASSYESGDGTVENPFEISSASQLAYLAQETNAGRVYHGQYFRLSNDIILNDPISMQAWEEDGDDSNVHFWIPIGTKENPFAAEFSGENYTITGVAIDSYDNHYAGLFGYVSNASIQDVNVSWEWIYAPNYVGGIAALVAPTNGFTATIENCTVGTADFMSYLSSRGYFFEDDNGKNKFHLSGMIGGVAGRVDSEGGAVAVRGCINYSTVVSRTTQSYLDDLAQAANISDYSISEYGDAGSIGGIIGYSASDDDYSILIESCVNYGFIASDYTSGFSQNYVGGVVGETDAQVCVMNCANKAGIVGAEGYCGSIVGLEFSDYEEGGYVSNCWYDPNYCEYAYGRVYDEDDSRVDIKVTTSENLETLEWLIQNLRLDPQKWTVMDGYLLHLKSK